jgi:uncharacterized protein YndB with AHSA1/START domain
MKWPSGFEPENSSVYARNEIVIAAPAERVWRWLIRAARWPDWYSNSHNIKFLSGHEPDLAPGTEFQWKTFGATIRSRVIVFEPPHELGWDARGVLRAYHGWLIDPDANGCRVVTEECQNGLVRSLVARNQRPMPSRAAFVQVVTAALLWVSRPGTSATHRHSF